MNQLFLSFTVFSGCHVLFTGKYIFKSKSVMSQAYDFEHAWNYIWDSHWRKRTLSAQPPRAERTAVAEQVGLERFVCFPAIKKKSGD